MRVTINPTGKACVSETGRKHPGGRREAIDRFSDASRRRLVRIATGVSALCVAMATLTYADVPEDGEKVKSDLHAFLKVVRDRWGSDYLWVMEFQRRDSVHFHVYLTKKIDKIELSHVWNGIISRSHGYDDITRLKNLRVGTRIETLRKKHALASYAAKYAAKADQKQAPAFYKSLGRWWGRSRGLKYDVEIYDFELKDCDKEELAELFVASEKKGQAKFLDYTVVLWGDAVDRLKFYLDVRGIDSYKQSR